MNEGRFFLFLFFFFSFFFLSPKVKTNGRMKKQKNYIRKKENEINVPFVFLVGVFWFVVFLIRRRILFYYDC